MIIFSIDHEAGELSEFVAIVPNKQFLIEEGWSEKEIQDLYDPDNCSDAEYIGIAI